MVYELSLYGSSIFYFCVIFFSVVLMHYAAKYDSKFILFLLIILLSIVIGFRVYVGRDYWNYEKAYEIIVQQGNIEQAKKFYTVEYSYMLVCMLSKWIGGTFRFVTTFYGFFTTLFYMLGIWYFRKNARVEWMMLYYGASLFWGSFNTIRQYLAIAIVFFAFRYVIEKKPIKYFLLMGIAIFFHTSAIIAVLIYFYGRKRNSIGDILRRLNWILPIILVFGVPSILKVVQSIGWARFNNYSINIHFGFGFLVQVVIVYLFFISVHKGENSLCCAEDKLFFVREILIVSSLFCILDYTLGDASRIRNYYSTIEMIAMATFPSTIFRNNSEDDFPRVTRYDFVLLGYYALYLLRSFIPADIWVYPYRFMM